MGIGQRMAAVSSYRDVSIVQGLLRGPKRSKILEYITIVISKIKDIGIYYFQEKLQGFMFFRIWKGNNGNNLNFNGAFELNYMAETCWNFFSGFLGSEVTWSAFFQRPAIAISSSPGTFAHGEVELQALPDLSKTSLCQDYAEFGASRLQRSQQKHMARVARAF